MDLEVDLVNAKQMVISSDLYYLLKDGEEPMLDMDAPHQAEVIHQMFPMGVVVMDDMKEVGEGKVMVTIATYREKQLDADFTFDYDFSYQLTNDLTLEVKWGAGRKSVQTRYNRRGANPYEYKTYEVKENNSGKQYFSTEYGSIFWLVDKYMRRK